MTASRRADRTALPDRAHTEPEPEIPADLNCRPMWLNDLLASRPDYSRFAAARRQSAGL